MQYITLSGEPHNALHSPSYYIIANFKWGELRESLRNSWQLKGTRTRYTHRTNGINNEYPYSLNFTDHVFEFSTSFSLVPRPKPPQRGSLPVYHREYWKLGRGCLGLGMRLIALHSKWETFTCPCIFRNKL